MSTAGTGSRRRRSRAAPTTILALIVIVLIVTHSSVFGKFSVTSLSTLFLVLAAGPVVYLIARTVRRSSSIDLDLAMRELPPE